ncbi:MAG: hypothetical protein AAF196_01315 [Planctomycetota bacterium]
MVRFAAGLNASKLAAVTLVAASLGVVLYLAVTAKGVEAAGDSESQDPIRAAEPPAEAAVLTPIQDPRGLDRRDVTDGAAPKGVLEGTWQLTAVQRGGLNDPGVAGVMIATRSHLVVHLQFAEGNEVRVQSSWRRYRIEDGALVTELLAGHSNLRGEFQHERPGTLEKRQLRFEGTRLRVLQDSSDFIEFVRIE